MAVILVPVSSTLIPNNTFSIRSFAAVYESLSGAFVELFIPNHFLKPSLESLMSDDILLNTRCLPLGLYGPFSI